MLDTAGTIITVVIALWGAVLSTYIFLRERVKITLTFEFGIIPLPKTKEIYPYCCLYIQNISPRTLYVKSFGFVDENKRFLSVQRIPPAVLAGYTKSEFHYGKSLEDIVTTNERLKLLEEKDHIMPYEGVYAFFDLDSLKKAISKSQCKSVFAQFSDGRLTKRTKLSMDEIMSLKTPSDGPLSSLDLSTKSTWAKHE